MDKRFSRRKFLHHFFHAPALLAGGILFAGCGQGNSGPKEANKAPAVDPCDDLSGIEEKDLKVREKLGYVKKSPIPDSTCDKCNLWLPPGADKPCGTCMLFKGPVDPSGYCTYWTARQG